MPITNREIKDIKALASKKFRDQTGLFIVEGEKMVKEAIESDMTVEKVFYKDDIGDEAMSRISLLSTPSPALAIVRKPDNAPMTVVDKGLFLALDSIRDPGNLGTILRIADWFGIKAVIASPDTVDLYNPKTVQSTMGAIFRMQYHICDLPSFCKSTIDAGGKVYGTFLDGRNIYERALATGQNEPSVIVIGNESNGISPSVEAQVSDRLYIPSFPGSSETSESLNAAVATAITVAEFRRRIWESQ